MSEEKKRKEAIKGLKRLRDDFSGYKPNEEMFDMAIVALSAEPCEDAISRRAALDAFGLSEKTRKYGGDQSGYDTMMLYEIQQKMEELPSVNPQPKTGHWIKDDITERSKSEYKHKCDRCGAYHRAMYDYCPSCGTRMESEKQA